MGSSVVALIDESLGAPSIRNFIAARSELNSDFNGIVEDLGETLSI